MVLRHLANRTCDVLTAAVLISADK